MNDNALKAKAKLVREQLKNAAAREGKTDISTGLRVILADQDLEHAFVYELNELLDMGVNDRH